MFSLSNEVRWLNEDWVETAELIPSPDEEQIDLVGLVVVARLVSLLDPSIQKVEGSTEDDPEQSADGVRVTFEDRRPDGVVPVTVRMLFADVETRLRSSDYRFDLIAKRDGLTATWASGVRRFRS